MAPIALPWALLLPTSTLSPPLLLPLAGLRQGVSLAEMRKDLLAPASLPTPPLPSPDLGEGEAGPGLATSSLADSDSLGHRAHSHVAQGLC